MSKDIEIIEDVVQIIEISDDDSLFDEEPEVLVLGDVSELEISDDDSLFEEKCEVLVLGDISEVEISDDDSLVEEDRKDLLLLGDVSEDPVVHKQIHKQITISAPISIASIAKGQNVNYKNKTTQSVRNNESNVACSQHSRLNEVSKQNRTFNADNHRHGDLITQSINSQPNVIISNNSLGRTQRKRRSRSRNKLHKQRQRIRRRAKNAANTVVGNSQCSKVPKTVQKSAKNRNVIAKNKSTDLTVLEQATLSSNVMTSDSNTARNSNNHDFSKLNWLRPLSDLSSPTHLQIVIIDRSHPEWKIANDKWLMIEKRLLEALYSEMIQTSDTSIGLFDGAKWQRGIKIVGCQNEHAFCFVTKFINNLDKLWFGAKLDAFPISLISRHIVKAYIPPPILNTELVISLIKLQNPSISSKDWKIIREREIPNNNGVYIWISINNESFAQICRLRGEIKYGINRIFLNPSY